MRLIIFLAAVAASILAMPPKPKPTENSGPQENCKTVISEVVMLPQRSHCFIEFQQKCLHPKKGPKSLRALKSYRLMLIRIPENEIVFIADLGDAALDFRDEMEFYTIGLVSGTWNIPNRGSQAIHNSNSKLPFENNKAFGIVLSHQPIATVSSLRLQRNLITNQFVPLPLNAEIIEMLKTTTVDFWFICWGNSCVHENSVKTVLPNSIFDKAPDRPLHISSDKGLSLCNPTVEAFRPEFLQLANPTPNAPNDCENSPVLQQDKCDVAVTLTHHIKYDSILGVQSVKTSDQNVDGKLMEKYYNEKQFQLLKQGYTHEFKPEWIDLCAGNVQDKELLKRTHVQEWLEVTKESNTCRFTCVACKKFFELGFRVDVNKEKKRKVISSAGFSSDSKCENYKEITSHMNNDVHQLASIFIKKWRRASNQNELKELVNEYQTSEMKFYYPTMNMLRLVYAELVADSSFSSHRVFVNAVKGMNVNLGVHHFHQEGMVQVLKTLSEEMHKNFLRDIVTRNLPFTLIADASTDNSNTPLLACLIQTIEDGRPISVLYRIINLKYGESAENMFRAFKEGLEEDELIAPGFLEFFKTNVVSIASDNASVMTSIKRSFYALIQKFVERDILCNGCAAHKLQLAVKHAVTDSTELSQFQKFEGECNKVYTFYMSRGSKKWDHFKSISKEVDLDIIRFKPFYQVRWASSHFHVVKAMVQNYDAVLVDLSASIMSEALGKTQKAQELYNIVTEKAFASCLREFYDFLKVFSEMSLKFEGSASTMIGKYKMIMDGISKLEKLSKVPGESLEQFLGTCVCKGTCSKGECSLEQFETCPSISCNDHPLNDNSRVRLSSIRPKLYLNFIAEMKSYFPLKELEALEILELQMYPNPVPTTRSFTNIFDSKVAVVCGYLHISSIECETFKRGLLDAVREIQGNQLLSSSYISDQFLTGDNVKDVTTRKVILTIMVIPFSSADAERCFSFVTRLKNRERSSLSVKMLENLVRVKFNGPVGVENFDAYYYSRAFLRTHVRVDDHTRSGGRKRKPQLEGDLIGSKRSKLF